MRRRNVVYRGLLVSTAPILCLSSVLVFRNPHPLRPTPQRNGPCATRYVRPSPRPRRETDTPTPARFASATENAKRLQSSRARESLLRDTALPDRKQENRIAKQCEECSRAS